MQEYSNRNHFKSSLLGKLFVTMNKKVRTIWTKVNLVKVSNLLHGEGGTIASLFTATGEFVLEAPHLSRVRENGASTRCRNRISICKLMKT